MNQSVSITITQQQNYRFVVDFGPDWAQVVADEPPPLGEDQGPAPTHFLLASVANCLCASLLFACRKFKDDPSPLSATASCTLGRNAQGRLRITGIEARIELGRAHQELAHIERVLEQFEQFCTVTESVRTGIPVQVIVADAQGTILKDNRLVQAPALG